MKRVLAIVLAAALVLTIGAVCAFGTEASYPAAKVTVNGQEVKWVDQEPVNISGMVFVPVRETLEAFGQEVVWNNADKSVTTTDKITGFKAAFGLSSEAVDTEQLGIKRTAEMAAAPMLINGKTMVSIRALTDIYGKKAGYDTKTATVLVEDYTGDDASVVTLSLDKAYEGYCGDVIKVHYASDGTVDYKATESSDFIYITKEAEGAGNFSMYFKAANANSDAALKIDKVTPEGKILGTNTYNANLKDPAATAVKLTAAEENITTVGKYITVELPTQAGSTGYSWFITALPSQLVLTSNSVEQPKEGAMPGAAVMESWTFKVVSEGQFTLQLKQMRSWSGEAGDVKEFKIKAVN